MIYIIYALVWIWQAPQNILGWLFTLGKKPAHILPAGVKLYRIDTLWPILVLGNYIIVSDKVLGIPGWIRHCFGHFLQSFRLGPLYLLVISIPSVFWFITCPKVEYYMEFYTEKWANKLSKKKKKK